MEDEIMEKKILDYLGVVDGHFQDVRQLENYTLTFQDGNYFNVNGKVEPNFEIERGYEFSNGNNMIIALLEKNENKGKNNKLKNKRKNMKKLYFPFDTGHLLAVGLIKYLKIDIIEKVKLVESNKNLIPQFQRANRNKKENIGQERFENWLMAYLKNHLKTKVYYEVEKIYKNNSDGSSLPIGTRIFATDMDNSNHVNTKLTPKLEMPFHVFIPNYQFSSDCEGQKNWPSFDLKDTKEDTKFDVPRLYEDGKYLKSYIEKLKKLQKHNIYSAF